MRFLLRRLVFYVIALWAAITLNFLLPRLMPGSPLDGLIANYGEQIRSNPQILQQLKASLGSADEPIWRAYPHYLGDIATGDFGHSFAKQAPVGVIIGNTLPWSIFLVGVGFLLSFVVGTTLGMLAAWRRGGITDNVATPVLMTLQSFPAFFLSLVAVYFLGLKLGWFPIQHAYDNGLSPGLNWTFLSSAIHHGLLPGLVIVLAFAGGWVLNMRTVMINTIGEDYVTMAHAKGLRDRRVMTWYAGRNAILPPLNGFAALFASAVGGLVFIEYIFSYPGAGLTLQQAVLGNDYALAQALRVGLPVTVILAKLVMDIFNRVLDPRLRTS